MNNLCDCMHGVAVDPTLKKASYNKKVGHDWVFSIPVAMYVCITPFMLPFVLHFQLVLKWVCRSPTGHLMWCEAYH